RPSWGRRALGAAPWLVAAAAIVAAGTSAWANSTPDASAQPPVIRFPVALPANAVLPLTSNASGRGQRFAVSPNGRTLVYMVTQDGVDQLYGRSLDQLEATPIAGTEGGTGPFFSPDGAWVGFLAAGKLKKVALGGGTSVTITDVTGRFGGGSWAPDDR